ncbi:hypothetical protein N656DRAFT_784909 [Canariomyces notabilis]|uniref:Uncharacterized protein n=1 Tax=Canariomyces notabilis TaxID=2074819 RepID=A0AAN6T7L3_9PEZI|nr:hypothetical protein N656DRAFT_784909 [Canariomyces arenarius]
MATSSIPGSYPIDDSLPPTPAETLQQPAPPEQHHRQPNKLHKPNDPRGHKYADSGVGLTDSAPIYSSGPDEHARNSPKEDVGQGDRIRDHIEPAEPIKSEPSEPINPESREVPPSQDTGREVHTAATRDNEQTLGTENSSGDSRIEHSGGNRQHRNSAPYWGDLPTGGGGGIYNSVTGHGSAKDDSAEHNHPRKRSASERSHISTPIAEHPRGGVYNTVTGHGSQDDESKRHRQPQNTDTRDSDATGHTRGLFAAPVRLADIPEQTQKKPSEPTTPRQQGQKELVPGIVPETTVRDDVRLAESASRGDAARSPHRAFPLAAANTETKSGDRNRSGARESYGPVAGASGLVVGSAVTGFGGQDSGTRQIDQAKRQPGIPKGGNGEHITGAAVSHKHENEKQTSPVQKTRSHEDHPTKGEKKHKILGIFHRHKDSSRRDDTSTSEPRRKSTGDRGELSKEQRTTRSANMGNSPSRLRKLSKTREATETRRSSELPGRDTHTRPGNDNGKGKYAVGAAAGTAAGAGVLGLHRHEKDETARGGNTERPSGAVPAGEAEHQFEEVSTPFEHPREPPPVPPTSGAKFSQETVTQEPGHYNTLDSGTASGVSRSPRNASPGSVGEGAVSKGENDSTRYNHLPSGTPSGVKVQPGKSQHHHDTNGAVTHHTQDQADVSNNTRAQHGLFVAPMPSSHHHRSEAINMSPNTKIMGSQEHPMQHQMSPEVMPAAYTASAPRSREETQDINSEPAEHHMSPEVMPSAYTAQTHAPRGQTQSHRTQSGMLPTTTTSTSTNGKVGAPPVLPPLQGLGQNNFQSGNSSSLGRDPALAAATASWGTTTGSSVGGDTGAGQKVVHKCVHCGRENDISGYLTRGG